MQAKGKGRSIHHQAQWTVNRVQRLFIAALLVIVLLICVTLSFLVTGLGFLGYLVRKQMRTVVKDLKAKPNDR